MAAILLASFFIVPSFVMASSDNLVISQVQVKGDGGTNDEFIEIYNPTPSGISLNGWSVQYKSSTGNYPLSSKKNLLSVTVCSQCYFLIAHSIDSSNNGYNGNVLADLLHSSFSLSAVSAGATIFLSNSTQAITSGTNPAIIDKFAYGNSPSNSPLQESAVMPTTTPAGDWSFLRVSYTDNNALDFVIQSSNPRHLIENQSVPQATSTPAVATSTPEQSGSVFILKSADVKISEILPNPDGEDSGGERVELENTGGQPVDLTGWYLGDKTDVGVQTNAYRISGESILPEGFLVLTIPQDFFVLNNSGGDALNLYFADKTLADSAVYKEDVKEGWSYQKNQDSWVWAKPTLGQQNFMAAAEVLENREVSVSEFMPNPQGPDEGREWVEFRNLGKLSASLTDFVLDHESSNAAEPGNSAWILDDSAIVPAGGFLLLNIPEDKFSLGNTGKDGLRLFAPGNKFLQQIEYQDAPEGQSFSRDQAGDWQFGLPTPGLGNAVDLLKQQVVISEIFPNPSQDAQEFVEIYNAGREEVKLKDLSLQIGTKTGKIDSEETLQPSAYYAILEDSLPARLNNNGQTILLIDALGRELDQVAYPKAPAGQTYALKEADNYFWTESPTPGQQNQFVLAASADESLAPSVNKSANQQSSAAKITDKQLSALLSANQEMKEQINSLQGMIADLSQQVADFSSVFAAPETQAAQVQLLNTAERPKNLAGYVLLSLGALAGLAFLVWKFFWQPKT